MRYRAGFALLIALAPACSGVALAFLPKSFLVLAPAVAYAACAIFLLGLLARLWRWTSSPVPFRIPTTCGQQRSLAWIPPARLDNPSTGLTAGARMLLEVLTFRSLLRNSRSRAGSDAVTSHDSLGLWLGAIVFHWSLLIILLRHLRLFVQPVPAFVLTLQKLDAPFHTGAHPLYLSDVALLLALAYLLLRRLANPLVRYVSLLTDYLALWLLLEVALTGVLMRYLIGVDVTSIKQFAVSLAAFSPVLPRNCGPWFFAHLFLACSLAAYIPFSKIAHMAGVWLSPTRNLANNNRAVRHINPWNAPVKTHTYAEWLEENKDKLKSAGIPE